MTRKKTYPSDLGLTANVDLGGAISLRDRSLFPTKRHLIHLNAAHIRSTLEEHHVEGARLGKTGGEGGAGGARADHDEIDHGGEVRAPGTGVSIRSLVGEGIGVIGKHRGQEASEHKGDTQSLHFWK